MAGGSSHVHRADMSGVVVTVISMVIPMVFTEVMTVMMTVVAVRDLVQFSPPLRVSPHVLNTPPPVHQSDKQQNHLTHHNTTHPQSFQKTKDPQIIILCLSI